jgi:hypothetical protein
MDLRHEAFHFVAVRTLGGNESTAGRQPFDNRLSNTLSEPNTATPYPLGIPVCAKSII